MKPRFLLCLFASVSVLAFAGVAVAEPTTQDKTLATHLSDEASKLFSDGQTAAACSKYAESERLDPELATLLHLGDCYAKLNKTASAWSSFKAASELATQRNDPRAPKISDRVAELEQKLSNLVIAVAENEPAELEIQEDGVAVAKASWGAPIPIDPGEHKITATAPGTKPREVSAVISDKSQIFTVHFPPVEYLPKETAAVGVNSTSSSEHTSSFRRHQRTFALVAGGVGVVGLGLGSAFGLMAKSTNDDSKSHCLSNHCDPQGHDLRESALSKATVSDVAFGVGAAALIGGAVLWFTAPKHRDETSASITPLIGPKVALISVQRSF